MDFKNSFISDKTFSETIVIFTSYCTIPYFSGSKIILVQKSKLLVVLNYTEIKKWLYENVFKIRYLILINMN